MNNPDFLMQKNNEKLSKRIYPITPANRLSTRELKVIEFAAQGLDNNEIAEILYISSHTVKAHIASAMRKLSANNRTNAVYKAVKLHIIE